MSAVAAVRASLRPAVLAWTALAVEQGGLDAAAAAQSLAWRCSLLPETPPPGGAADWEDRVGFWCAILEIWRRRAAFARHGARRAIRDALGPMILARQPSAELLARANDINGAHRAVLAGEEVLDIVIREVTWKTKAPRR